MNHAVVDLQFGDAGKGTTVETYTQYFNAKDNARFSGSYNAAHHVVLADGRSHCFSTFGSGTLLGAQTYLSCGTLFNPLAAQAEAEVLATLGIVDPLSLLTVSSDSLVVTPLHAHLSKMREVARGNDRKGSCGKGVGEAIFDRQVIGKSVLRVSDLLDRQILRQKLEVLWESKKQDAWAVIALRPDNKFLRDTYDWLCHPQYVPELLEAYGPITEKITIKSDSVWLAEHRHDPVIWEGSQGALLDAFFGFVPYITRSRTTTTNLFDLVDPASTEVSGVLRAYTTRHGRGPFPTEDRDLTQRLPDTHNQFNPWQEAWRVGWLDMVLLKYALSANGGDVNSLVVTNLDRLASFRSVKVCVGYRPSIMDADIERLCQLDRHNHDVIITDLKLPNNNKEQESLSRIISSAVPVYIEIPWNETKYLDLIRSVLGKPIILTSHGPTINDKVWHHNPNRL